MEFMVFVLLAVFIIGNVASYLQTKKYTDKKIDCPPHKWSYNERGYLHCSICKKTTEQIIQ